MVGFAGAACDPSTDETPVPTRAVLDAGAALSSDAADPACANVACGDASCCSGVCVDPAWDDNNCGACGVSCALSDPSAVGMCASGACGDLGLASAATLGATPLAMVLSGSVLYADAPRAGRGPLVAIDLGAPGSSTGSAARALQFSPVYLPIADGRGGVYYFDVDGATGHARVSHYDYGLDASSVVDDLGAAAVPHVLVRQGDSVARIFSPTVGVLRTTCANGNSHDFSSTTGVAYAAADLGFVYFGFGSPVTPAVAVSCDAAGTIANLPTTFGHVLFVDDANLYWFGVDLTMDAATTDGIFASAKDGNTPARLLAYPPESTAAVSFPLLAGDLLYFEYGVRPEGAAVVNVLASVSVSTSRVVPWVQSPLPITADPAFAYTAHASTKAGSDAMPYRIRLAEP